MRRLMYQSLTGIIFCVLALAAHGSSFSGKFHGVVSNEPMDLSLLQQGSVLTGKMTAGDGSFYQIKGTVIGNTANCEGLYSKNQSTWNFTFTIRDNGLLWTPTMLGIPLPNAAASFKREGTASALSGSRQERRPELENSNDAIDQRFVGTWIHTNTYVSDRFTAASDKHVQFQANGRFTYSKGPIVGGGNSGSFQSRSSGNSTHGKWKTQNKILYYLVDGKGNWEGYGRYSFTDDGRTMMIVFDNGDKELWER